ncbi:MAG: endonuclease/exonuclease/phosphatase family protein [Erythrobacter sp.]
MALLLVAGSLMSTTDLNQWWIRVWDFPRLQLLIAMVVLSLALLFLDRKSRPWLPLALAFLSAWQATRVFPYTPLAATEVERVADGEVASGACFSVLTLNVLQDNRDYDRTANLIREVNPDIVLLMETDAAWVSAMAPVLSEYPGQLSRPLDNKYGLHFATRLPMAAAHIRDLAQKDTPSVFATLRAGNQPFLLTGLHPRPPQPGQDTEERDAEIIIAAREARESGMPVLAVGDFNDVAWSDTTRLFKRLGGFLDPRVGRGTYSTFPADWVWLGWPLDYLFVTDQFLLSEMRVGGPVGSDHLPVIARLCLSSQKGEALNEDPDMATADDREEAVEVIEDFEEDTEQDRVEGE